MPSQPIITGAVRGLVSEGARVAALIRERAPDAVGLSVSKEGLEAMGSAKVLSGKPTNAEERAYIRGLAQYGEAVKPPPCFSEALRQAGKLKINVLALDMDDEHYTAAYCKYINTFDMIRQGRRDKEFSRYVFRSRNPEDFVVEWDRLVNRLGGYRALEKAREYWLAKRIAKLGETYTDPFIVIEYERLAGVSRQLKTAGLEFSIIH